MRDIAFMGHARSGKDTAGRYLVENHGFRRVSFADPVRESLLRCIIVVWMVGSVLQWVFRNIGLVGAND